MIKEIKEYLASPEQFRGQITDDQVVVLFRKSKRWDDVLQELEDVETVHFSMSLHELGEAENVIEQFIALCGTFSAEPIE